MRFHSGTETCSTECEHKIPEIKSRSGTRQRRSAPPHRSSGGCVDMSTKKQDSQSPLMCTCWDLANTDCLLMCFMLHTHTLHPTHSSLQPPLTGPLESSHTRNHHSHHTLPHTHAPPSSQPHTYCSSQLPPQNETTDTTWSSREHRKSWRKLLTWEFEAQGLQPWLIIASTFEKWILVGRFVGVPMSSSLRRFPPLIGFLVSGEWYSGGAKDFLLSIFVFPFFRFSVVHQTYVADLPCREWSRRLSTEMPP